MRSIHSIVLGAFIFAATPAAVFADINYGHILAQRGNALYIEYKGPGGTFITSCDIDSAQCEKRDDSPVFPSIAGTTQYAHSPDGQYGVREFSAGSLHLYVLYNLGGGSATQAATIPVALSGATISFSRDGNAVIFIKGNQAARYDIATKAVRTIALSQSELPFKTASYRGNFLSAYNWTTKSHTIWGFDGSSMTVSNTAPSYLEFSDDESRIAFARDVEGFKTLFSGPRTGPYTQITTPKAIAEDYLFVGDTLYYLANVDHPLEWDLFSYAPGASEVGRVASDVSYGDYLARVNDNLAFIKIEGEVAHVNLYSPEDGVRVLAGAPASPTTEAIVREKVVLGGRHGVLLSPAEGDSAGKLFIWLHGGPERQVAVGYHPYLSYAVYDQLLEKIAAAGNTVLKLDYTGSYGYGSTFQNALHLKIGDVDVKDVMNALAELADEKDFEETYLIGNSYGGYLAFKALNDHPESFAGAISVNGVSDWYGLISRIPSSIFTPLFAGAPSDQNLQAYFNASVFTDLDKIDDQRVLVVYGEEDKTVPTDQSVSYVQFAESKNVDVSLLALPGEEHIIRDRKSLDTLCDAVKEVTRLEGLSCK